MPQTSNQPVLYNFLVSPKYRILRHVLLILGIAIISFNQTFVLFEANVGVLGYKIFLLGAILWVLYLFAGYFNLLVLIPKYLLKKRYVFYIVTFTASVVLFLIGKTLLEYLTYYLMDLPQERQSYFNLVSFMDAASNFMLTTLAFIGVSTTVLLKHWLTEEERVNELEKVQIQSKVRQLKEQVTPQFLFNILKKTSELVKTDPQKTTSMLLKLSQLLRYQLYDCNRDKVLLNPEINFLNTYLELEKMYSGKFDYVIDSEGDMHMAFVSPMLFIPFVHQVVSCIYEQDTDNQKIHLSFKLENKKVHFCCYVENEQILINTDYTRIKQRLHLIYGNEYTFSEYNNKVCLDFNQFE